MNSGELCYDVLCLPLNTVHHLPVGTLWWWQHHVIHMFFFSRDRIECKTLNTGQILMDNQQAAVKD